MSQLSERRTTKRTVSNNPPIANEINAATKSLHTELNRLIIDRLPLALPPWGTTPSRYAAGLRRFAPIFFAFEAAFKAVAEQAKQVSASATQDKHNEAILDWVASLAPTDLQRSTRLREDLDHLQLLGYHGKPRASDVLKNLPARARDQPHILVAYAWVMYMAIFSGGRWIRSQLSSAGPAFWLGVDEAAGLQIDPLPGFDFLSFDDGDDGESLKSAFKSRLEAADTLLTEAERQEVVATGIDVFEQCIQLIGHIDRDVWWNECLTSWHLALLVLTIGIGLTIWQTYKG